LVYCVRNIFILSFCNFFFNIRLLSLLWRTKLRQILNYTYEIIFNDEILAGFLNERRCIYEKVLPTVRSKCSQIGYELHVSDLCCDHHQLQQQKYAQLNTAVRLSELRRQNLVGHVVPIVFVDDSLDSPVLPPVMSRQDLDLVKASAPEASKLIEKWYTLDTQKDNYELRNEMTFETQVYTTL